MSRRCNDAIEQVYFFLDGEITWYKRVQIRRHLKACSDCDNAFGFETRFKEVIRAKGYEEPEPELISRLRAFLDEQGADEAGA